VKRFVALQFLNLRHSVGPLGRVIIPSQGRYLTQTQNKRTQTSMSLVGTEPMIPAFERAKTVHALDRAATVTGGHDVGAVLIPLEFFLWGFVQDIMLSAFTCKC
jgi:hypothetical protein